MDAWVYLFSKFTHEALLFEALALFLGLFGYAIFYLIRKRKYGVAGKDVPSNIVKVYLGQLVADAEEIRTQLFGLLGKGESSARFLAGLQFQTDVGAGGASIPGAGATVAGAAATTAQLAQDLKPDPKLQEKLKELEKRLAEQSNALDSVLNEKMKLEEELANAKNDAPALSADTADANKGEAGPDRAGPLQERVKQLEAQLAEYAIIEDDLANLKRLQKENKTLKEQLASAAEKGTAPAAEPAPAGPELTAKPAAPAPAPEAEPAVAAPVDKAPNFDLPSEEKKAAPVLPDPSESGGENIATEMVDNLHANDPAHPNDFESLVDVVEKNLADAAKSDTVDPNAPNPEPDFQLASGPTAELISDEKSEEQLQADFEKMLKS